MRTVRWIVPVIVVLLGAVLWLPISGHGRWFAVLLNAGHGLVFAAVAVLCKIGLRGVSKLGAVAQYAAAFGIAVGLGGAIEILQLPIGRDADLADAGRNALGAWAGLAGLAALAADVPHRRRVVAALSSVVPIALLALPAVESAMAYARRAADFPVLADFAAHDRDYFMDTVQASVRREALPQPWPRVPGERALRVAFVAGPYSGVDFFEPEPDWTAYRELAIDVTNPGTEELELGLRVHDAAHDQRYEDRYNRVFVLAPEQRTTLAVPLDEIERGPRHRALDLMSVADLMLFVALPEGPSLPARELLLSRIWLR